ncbi:hypothetical protein BJ166DRAFT_499760 [Pestalotiopsis sp. NC0098]|nr:hypothetical protein BJ166DRAFT_499760 [Pestalotiopsis sp. NC0098]
MTAPRDNPNFQMTKTLVKDYVKRDNPAFHGPLEPIYLGKPMFRCSGGFAIVRKSEPFAVCIPSDFAVHVAQAFKRKEDVNTAIKECLGNQGADGRYLCALWDVTEDDKQDLPAEENFVDGGDRGKLLGENWLTYKLFLQHLDKTAFGSVNSMMLKDFVSLEITNTMLKYPIPPLLILKATNSIHFIIRTWPLEPQLGRAWDPSWVQVLTSSERVPMIYNWPIRKVNWVGGPKWGICTKPDSASLVEQLSPAGC